VNGFCPEYAVPRIRNAPHAPFRSVWARRSLAVAAVGGLDRQDPETVTAVAAEFGIEILGPPGTMPWG